MREILFRAKALGTTQWVYGYYYREEPPLECFNTGLPKKYKQYICTSGFADWSMPRPIDMQEIDIETLGIRVHTKRSTQEDVFSGDRVYYEGKEYEVVFDGWRSTLERTMYRDGENETIVIDEDVLFLLQVV